MQIDTTPYTYLIGWRNLNIFYYGRRTAVGCSPADLWVTYFTSSPAVKKFVAENGKPDLIEIRKIFNSKEELKQRVINCASWENRFLRKVKAAKNPIFLNKSNGDAKFNVSGMVSAIDTLTDKLIQVSMEEFNNSKGRFKGAGFKKVHAILLSSGKGIFVSTEEFHANRDLYTHHAEGTICITEKSTGQKLHVSTEEFHANRNLYTHHSEGYVMPPAARAKIKAGNLNKPKSDEHRQNIATALKGKKKTAEHVANSNRNRSLPFKAVIINGIYFYSVNAAAAHFCVKSPAISNRLAGRKKLNSKFWEVRYAEIPNIS